MMTQTKARALDLTEPRLAPLRRDDLPSFLVDVATSDVIYATSACARLGVAVGRALPPRVLQTVGSIAESRARALAMVRLRLPRSLTPRLFHGHALDLAGAPAVLFADPAALAEDQAPGMPAHAPFAGPHVVHQLSFQTIETSTRFTFETDAADRVSGFSPALATALGEDAQTWIGATFPELEATGRILSARAITEALADGASFSGVKVTVPGAAVLELELGGVPLFDAARRRVATRGFGVLRRWIAAPAAPAFDLPSDPDAHEPLSTIRPVLDALGAGPATLMPLAGLTPRESHYFQEIGRTLEAAMSADAAMPAGDAAPTSRLAGTPAGAILDALPLATLLEDDRQLLHANRAFLGWTGWSDLDTIQAAGGIEGVLDATGPDGAQLLTATGAHLSVDAETVPATFITPEARLHLLRLRTLAPERHESPSPGDTPPALDVMPWPVFVLDADHVIHFANRAAAARFGVTAGELEGRPITVLTPPEAHGEIVGWLDEARVPDAARRPRMLSWRTPAGMAFQAPAGIAAVPSDAPAPHVCLVLGPEPQEAPAPAGAADDGADMPAPEAGEAPSGLHLVARRLTESLRPSFSTLTAFDPADAAPELPEPVRDALERVRKCLDDLGALSAPLAEAPPEPTAVGPLVEAAIAEALAVARRRHIIVRTDIDPVPLVSTRPARLARLLRLMIEEALDGAPAGTAILVSLMCDDASAHAPVVVQVADAGPAVDEVDDAAARTPLAPSEGTDRFSRTGRPLRRARLAEEADALGAVFELRRGLARGMITQLSLPR